MYSFASKLILIICFALFISANVGAQEKRLNVSKGDKLTVNINYGEITITTWDKNQIVIKSDAEDDENENGLKINQSGNTITVNGGASGSDVTISAPSNFNFDVKTNAGSVVIKGNITGKVNLNTSGGDIAADNIYGTINATTSGGNISIHNVKGGGNLNSAGGDLTVGDIEGDLVLTTGGGNVKAGKISKSLKLKTGGGNILVNEIVNDAVVNTGGGNILIDKSGSKIDLTTGGGDIRINVPKGEMTAKTGSGTINIQNASNKMNIFTGSGDAEISFVQNYKGNSDIKSSNGDIKLYLPANIKATIITNVRGWKSSDNGDSGIDNIISDFKASTVNLHNNDNAVTATAIYQINGGGNNINLTVSNGYIYLKRK